MKIRHSKRMVAAMVLLLISLSGGALLAQSSVSFQIERSVIAGGGSSSSSANFGVMGTLGQAGAGPPSLSSSSYQVHSGFWQPVAPTATPTATPTPGATVTPTVTPTPDPSTIYLPLITR